MKGVALFSLGGYLYSWDKTGKTLVQNIIHRILAESISTIHPHLRFGMPGPGLPEVMKRASATSHMVIKSKFDQNFLPKPIACNVISLLNFLGSQELRYFNDIFDYEDNSSIPLSLSFERISSLLTLAWQNVDGDCETLESSKTVSDGILQIFVATSLNQIVCKETALADIAEKDIQYQLTLGQFDAIETGFLYVYIFLSSL